MSGLGNRPGAGLLAASRSRLQTHRQAIESDIVVLLLMRRPPRSTRVRSSAASDVYKRQPPVAAPCPPRYLVVEWTTVSTPKLSLIHISEPTRLLSISYAVFCLKKKKK